MDKHINKILILNKKYYLDKIISYNDYINELHQILQTTLLEYNMVMQTEYINILTNFNKLNLDNIIKNQDTINKSTPEYVIPFDDLQIEHNPILLKSDEPEDNDSDIINSDNEDTDEPEDNASNEYTDGSEDINEYENENDLYFDQCCARIDNVVYNLDDYEPEFIDNYPAGVYISREGHIIGSPCCNSVSEFDEINNIFCEEHKENYEDIREEPYYI